LWDILHTHLTRNGCKVVNRVLYKSKEIDGSDGEGRLGNDRTVVGKMAISVRKMKALIVKMNILQNYDADDRD